MDNPAEGSNLLVEVVGLKSEGNRPVSLKTVELATLDEYSPLIKDAIVKVAEMLNAASIESAKKEGGMRVDEIEATFSLTLGAEGKLIVAKASAQATLSVTLRIRRP